MAIRSEPGGPPGHRQDECAIRIAATGDIHLGRPADEERWTAAFGSLRDRVDVVLLAGDLTTHGVPEQAAMVARAVQVLDGVPVLAVLGNHDWHANRRDEVAAALAEAGIGTSVHFIPVHQFSAYAELLGPDECASVPVTDRVAEEMLSLPLYPDLTDSDVDLVAGRLTDLVTADLSAPDWAAAS